MGAERLFAWALLTLWSTWLFALQGILAAGGSLGTRSPDMGVLLLLMLDRRCSRSSMLFAVLIVSSARMGFSADPPLAILFGYALLVGGMRLLRRVVEVDQALIRALIAGLGFLALNKYWAMARGIALAQGAGQVTSASVWTRELPAGSWGQALSTALGILILGPILMHLPGLSPLRRGQR